MIDISMIDRCFSLMIHFLYLVIPEDFVYKINLQSNLVIGGTLIISSQNSKLCSYYSIIGTHPCRIKTTFTNILVN